MLTTPAARSLPDELDNAYDTVTSSAVLRRAGWSAGAIRAQVDARRWQRFGRAIVLHNGAPERAELWQIALRNSGRQAVLTAFTAAEALGLTGWERDPVHVLVPGGTRVRHVPDLLVRVHYARAWADVVSLPVRRAHKIAPAVVLAAGTFRSARPAVGILAAAVQQRLASATDLEKALLDARRVRHHAVLLAAPRDIAQGADALSEIDFVRLCRRFGKPAPQQQSVRTDGSGRRRYLDATWRRRDGRLVAVEVDGALHLTPARWWDDQSRQNDLVLAGTIMLRFPSVVVRTEPDLVAAQLRRLLD
ncbi:MAG: hypothetical protein QOH14_1274 [Pseudonocardiales bacterium]|nr:hypothetical protein [Pseudonocardiales bacterium]